MFIGDLLWSVSALCMCLLDRGNWEWISVGLICVVFEKCVGRLKKVQNFTETCNLMVLDIMQLIML